MSKVILITGASRGIGAATARLAGEQGYHVCINYNGSQDAAEDVAGDVIKAGGKAITVKANMAEPLEITQLFEAVDRDFGRLDVLVNNAGVLGHSRKLIEMDAARFDWAYAINIRAPMLCAIEAIKRMSTTQGGDGGSIVNLSSAASRLGSPNEFVDYAATKGAIDSFTIGLSKEIGPEGIRVNAVRPGIIETDIHASAGDAGRVERFTPHVPLKRAGSALETAQAILWLASEDASYVSGTFLDVTGGR